MGDMEGEGRKDRKRCGRQIKRRGERESKKERVDILCLSLLLIVRIIHMGLHELHIKSEGIIKI